jgi:hypothetical protein
MPFAADAGGFPQIGRMVTVNPGTGVSNSDPGISTSKIDLVRPWSSDFPTVVGTITVADKIDRMALSVTSTSGIRQLLRPIPGAPYTIDFAGTITGAPAATNAMHIGIALSDGTKVVGVYAGTDSNVMRFNRASWTNATTFSANVKSYAIQLAANLYYIRVTDDGATRTLYLSQNGKDFCLMYSEATNTFATPTLCGIIAYNNSTDSVIARASVYHFQVTNGILGDAP